jgi:hypothetical protein
VRRLPLVAVACLLLAGCVRPVAYEFTQEPDCKVREGRGARMVLLMAQAVPSASQIPCVELKPAGWSVGQTFVRNGRARFSLDSDRVGTDAVQVILERTCNFGRVTRVPSDHPGARRYHEVIAVETGKRYQGAVYYVFPGGCVTYRLDFHGPEQARPLGEVTLALGFVTREAVAKAFSDYTDGRLQLDPPPAGER